MSAQDFGPDPEPTEWRDYGNGAYEISREGYARGKKRKKYLTLVTDGSWAPYYYVRLPSKKGVHRQTTRSLYVVVKVAWNIYMTITEETALQMKRNIMEWNLANSGFTNSSGMPCDTDIVTLVYGEGCSPNSIQFCPFPGVKGW